MSGLSGVTHSGVGCGGLMAGSLLNRTPGLGNASIETQRFPAFDSCVCLQLRQGEIVWL